MFLIITTFKLQHCHCTDKPALFLLDSIRRSVRRAREEFNRQTRLNYYAFPQDMAHAENITTKTKNYRLLKYYMCVLLLLPLLQNPGRFDIICTLRNTHRISEK